MAVYIGIDPGSQGALCALEPATGKIEFHDTPGAKKNTTILHVFDWLADIQNRMGPIRMIGIEDVHSLPGMSAKSNFTFGYNVGVLHAICQCSKYSVDLIRPLEWQRAIKAPSRKAAGGPTGLKKAVAGIASRLYPSASLYGPKGGLYDGRADALMIAHSTHIKYP